MTIISMLPILAMAGTMTPSGGAGFRLPPSLSRTLDNGVRIYVMEFRGLPLVNCNVVVGAGAALDPKGKEGLADLTATLLRKGTTGRSAMEIASDIDQLGATLDAVADLKARADVQRQVKAENADREELYKEIAATKNVDLAQLPKIRETYAATLRQNAKPGDWIQQPDGNWVKK